MGIYLDLDDYYECPDCGEVVQGHELQGDWGVESPFACPRCGCIQDVSEVEQQLGTKEEDN